MVRALDAIEKAEASAAAAAARAPSRAGGLFRRFRLPFLGKKPAVAPVVEAAVESVSRSRVDQPGSAAPQAGPPSLLTRAKSWIDPSAIPDRPAPGAPPALPERAAPALPPGKAATPSRPDSTPSRPAARPGPFDRVRRDRAGLSISARLIYDGGHSCGRCRPSCLARHRVQERPRGRRSLARSNSSANSRCRRRPTRPRASTKRTTASLEAGCRPRPTRTAG